MKVPEDILNRVFDQAKREYPYECCGMIIEHKESNPEFAQFIRRAAAKQEEWANSNEVKG